MIPTVRTLSKSARAAMLGVCAAAALIVVGAAPARAGAADVPKLMAEKRCIACHDTNKLLIGPPYLAVATRFANDRDEMVEVLARKIVLGGGGSWGVVPMVPNEHVTLAEAREMAQWILSLRPPG